MSGSALNWTIVGDESTIDHYTAFISSDGTNLMSLGDFPAGTRTVNLASFGFDTGTYSVYVKAVGKPSILNHMSAAATYSSGPPAPQPPVAQLSLSPGSGTAPLAATASTASSTDPQASAHTSTIDFGDGTSSPGPTASHTYANAGSYTVKATVSNALGLSAQASGTVTVSASAPGSVTVAEPANSSTVSSPIHVVASGPPVGSTPCKSISTALWYSRQTRLHSILVAMQIYLDGNLIYRNSLSQVDTYISVSVGTHRITLKAWDGSGAAYMQQAYVTAN